MAEGIVCSSSELKIAYHNIERYAGSLISNMQKYVEALSYVQEYAVDDDLISAGLSELARIIIPCMRSLGEIAGHDISLVINREISEIEAADNFLFPDRLLRKISSMLAVFHFF